MIDTATGVMEPAARSGATDAHAAAAGRAGLIARRELFEQLGARRSDRHVAAMAGHETPARGRETDMSS